MNALVPALVADTFRESRIVAFSTGNVYPLTTVGRQAAEETFRDGLFRFSFHRIEAGAAFEFQIAQQINPGLWGTNRGRVVFLDGDTVLAEMPVALRVLP
jgi:hypothetical protein